MQIEIEGTRTSDYGWLQSRSMSVEQLRELTAQEIAWPDPVDAAAEQLARKLYGYALTEPELVSKCDKLGRLISDWLRQSGLRGEVTLVRLRCLRGRFDVHVSEENELHRLEIREELVDDLLEAGSREAAESLDRLLSANLGRFAILKAS